MAFVMIDADQTILSNVKLTMLPPDPVDGWFGGGTPGVFGQRARRILNFMLPELTSVEIPLQFPPRIKSNSKAMNWDVTDMVTYEPKVVLVGAKETKLSIELKYVVGAGTGWGVQRISNAVHDIMGYFYRSIQAGQKGKAPLLQIQLYEVAPGGESTWRINNANITQTDELILDKGKIYPQVTTVTLDMAMLTQIANAEGKNPRQPGYKAAPKKPKKEWY